jgi:hypothetical protein
MVFRVTPANALAVATDIVQAEVLRIANLRRTWTAEQLIDYFQARGLDITPDQMARINDELHTRGIVEDVR